MEPIPSYGVPGFQPQAQGETRSVPLQMLAALPLFKGLDATGLEAVARLLRPRDYATGDFVYRQGTEPDGLYLLESGEMLMWTRVCDSRRDIVRFQSGSPLCLASLVEVGGRVTSMEALEPSRVWLLDVQSFEGLSSQGHPVAFRVLNAAATELNRSFSKVSAHFRAMLGLEGTSGAQPAAALPLGRPIAPADVPQLKVLPFVKALGGAELEALCRIGRWRELPRGAQLFKEGAPAGDAHLIVRGALEAQAEAGERKQRLSVRGPGRWAGQAALLTGEVQPYSVVVKESAALFSVTRADLDALLGQLQPLAQVLLRQLAAAAALEFNQDLPTLMRDSNVSGATLPVTSVDAQGIRTLDAVR